ncbi:MAG: hypothetical protein R3325_13640 [Thermoanaerobaculia bacterium]|nr:hypothetical protein [Thermoanaerobaculia bacterium]
MKRPHLLAVEGGAEAVAPLVETLAAAGHRVGWLDLTAAAEAPPELAEASRLPLLRAVAVGAGRSVAVKRRRGAPVLDDLLREHFLGCRLVLVRGASELPRLSRDGDLWRVDPGAGKSRSRTAEELARDLRRPRPW